MNLLTRVMAAEEDHIEEALLYHLRLYNAARKQHDLPIMGQPDFRDEAQAQALLDRLFLPCLPFGERVADTEWSTSRLFGWFFLEESANGGLAFLDFDGPLPPEAQECETFFNAAATARDKESLFVVLAPLVLSRFIADGTEPVSGLFMFRGRSLWHRLGQACTRHTHWPSARTELVLLTLLRFIRVLYGGGRSNIPETTVELLASVVLGSSNQQLLLAGLELVRALVTGGSGNDSGASELYPEGGGRKLGLRLLSLSDRGGAPSEVRELAIDCLHPANISPDFELRGEYLNRLWDVCRNCAHEPNAVRVSALTQLTVFHRRNEGEPFASDHLDVILSILTHEDKAAQRTASYLLDSYLSQPGAPITAELLPRIVSVLIANTLLSKPGVPPLVGLCLDHWVEHSAALEGFLARLPADLSAKLANHHKDAQRGAVASREESEAVREVSAMCLERMAADQPEQVVAEVWQQVGPTLRRDSPWQIRERAFTLLGVLAQVAPGRTDHLVAPHMELLIQSLADPVAEVRATSAWTLVFYVRLVADGRLAAIVEALLAMARRDDAKSCQAATSALVDLLMITPPLLDEETQTTIVREGLAMWDNPPSPKAGQRVLDVFSAWVRYGSAGEQSRAELVPALMGRLLAQPNTLEMQTGIFHIFANLADQGTCCAVCNIPASLVAEVVNACVSPIGDHVQQGDDDQELPTYRLRWALRVLSTLSRDPRGYDLSGLVASPDLFVDELIKPGLKILTVETLEDCFTVLDHVIEHWPQALAPRHSQLTPSLFNFVLRLPHPRATLFPLLVRMGLAYATPESRPLSDYVSADTLAALPLGVLLAWADALLPDSPSELLRGLARQPESSADDTHDTRNTQHAAQLVQAHARVIVDLLTTHAGDLPDTFGARERAAMLRVFCHHHHATNQPTSDLATRALELLIAGDGEAVAAELSATLPAAERSALALTAQQLMPVGHAFSRLLA